MLRDHGDGRSKMNSRQVIKVLELQQTTISAKKKKSSWCFMALPLVFLAAWNRCRARLKRETPPRVLRAQRMQEVDFLKGMDG